MYIKSWITTCAFVAVSVVTLVACNQQSPQQAESATKALSSVSKEGSAPVDLQIISWGPKSTKAGLAFNAQSDGSAALWMNVNQSLVGDKVSIEFNGVRLNAAVTKNAVSALVPAKLYVNPGSYKVHIIVRKDSHSIKSNDVTFTVQ